MSNRFCNCKRCRKIRKTKGLVLGARRMSFWMPNMMTGVPEHYQGMVSDYVPHPKFAKGRVRKERNDQGDL